MWRMRQPYLVQVPYIHLNCASLTHPFTALRDGLMSFGIVVTFLYFGICILNQRLLVQMRHKFLCRRSSYLGSLE